MSSQSPQPRFSGIFLLTSSLAFFAGIVGALVGTVLFANTPVSDGDALSILRNRRNVVVQDGVDIAALQGAFRASVTFVATSDVPKNELPIGEEDVIASGVVLTTDGWLMAVRKSIPEKFLKDPKTLSVIIGNRAYQIEEMTHDPYSGVLFLRTDAADLSIVDFAYDVSLQPGTLLYVPTNSSEGFYATRLVAEGVLPAKKQVNAIQSTENLLSVLRLDGAAFFKEDVFSGRMLVTGDGRIVGMIAENEDGEVYGVPFGVVSKEISTVLRGEIVSRPYFGAFVLPLDHVIGVDEDSVVRGARLVAGPNGEAAVLRRSPADVGGLVAGDVILTVNGEAVTSKRPLADILADYSGGNTVVVGILHEGVAKEVQVTLGVQPVR